ncbi:MAG: hypothetical protein ACF8PN_14565 [Phycisphaerales bacterium]
MHDPKPSAETRSSSERVSTALGDRLCIRCGYNLCGQPVVREPHYDMLIIRCPECSTVALLEEYPTLGKWAGRWAALFAALWFVVVLVVIAGAAGILFGYASLVTELAVAPYVATLGESHRVWVHEQAAAGDAGAQQWVDWYATSTTYATSWVQVDERWYGRIDPEALIAQTGGFGGAIDWSAIRLWIMMTLALFPFAAVIAVAALHLRRRYLVLTAALVVVIALAFYAVAYTSLSSSTLSLYGYQTIGGVARAHVGWAPMLATFLYGFVALAVLMYFARPIVRFAAHLLLPPRLRSGVAILWIAEGLDPPTRTWLDQPLPPSYPNAARNGRSDS